MACGLPVIVSEVGGSTDIVQQGVNGYVVPAKDQATLNRALDTLVDDPAKRQRMGQVGRKIAEQKFEIGQNTKLIIESLKEIVKY
jgi:glycosyltransferase involved in cell wall biosynthesis